MGNLSNRTARIGFTVVLVFLGTCSSVRGEVLYDAGLGTTPDQQGWTYLTSPLSGAQATQIVSQGALELDTRSVLAEQAGYFRTSTSIDLSSVGFVLSFMMQQVNGVDLPDSDPLASGERNRGGLSLIAISENLMGIEIQFQSDHVIALDDRNTAFPIGESAALDTTVGLRSYELILNANEYRLLVDNQPKLQGPLRDYTTIAPSPPAGLVYSIPNLLFFGDNTGRGAALTRLSHMEAFTIPEPSTCIFLSFLAVILVRRRI